MHASGLGNWYSVKENEYIAPTCDSNLYNFAKWKKNPAEDKAIRERGTANLITRHRYLLWKLVSLKRHLSLHSNKADPHLHYKGGQAEPFQRRHLDCFLFSLSRFVLRHKNAPTQWLVTSNSKVMPESQCASRWWAKQMSPWGQRWFVRTPPLPSQCHNNSGKVAIKFLGAKGDIPAEGGECPD